MMSISVNRLCCCQLTMRNTTTKIHSLYLFTVCLRAEMPSGISHIYKALLLWCWTTTQVYVQDTLTIGNNDNMGLYTIGICQHYMAVVRLSIWRRCGDQITLWLRSYMLSPSYERICILRDHLTLHIMHTHTHTNTYPCLPSPRYCFVLLCAGSLFLDDDEMKWIDHFATENNHFTNGKRVTTTIDQHHPACNTCDIIHFAFNLIWSVRLSLLGAPRRRVSLRRNGVVWSNAGWIY